MRPGFSGNEPDVMPPGRIVFPASSACEGASQGAPIGDLALVVETPPPGAKTGWRSVRPSAGERSQPLPGDDPIAQPLASLTHAITIHRAPRDVWPWLARMAAARRAGWYSSDVLGNAGARSSERIVPELQELTPRVIYPALPGVTDCFTLVAFEPERYLILGWRLDRRLVTTCAFVLEDVASSSTRLIVRARGGSGDHFHGLPWWLTSPIIRVMHFIMRRNEPLGIMRRAQSMPARTLAPVDRGRVKRPGSRPKRGTS
jgi:hypothetical protein